MTRSGDRGFLTSHDRQTLREADSGSELKEITDRETLKRIQNRTKQALADLAFLQHQLPANQSGHIVQDAFSEEEHRLPYDDELFDQETIVNALTFILEGIATYGERDRGREEVESYIERAVRQMYRSCYSGRVLGDVCVEANSERLGDALQSAPETLERAQGDLRALSTTEIRAMVVMGWLFDRKPIHIERFRDWTVTDPPDAEILQAELEIGSEAEILTCIRKSPTLLEEDLEVAIAEPAESGRAPVPDLICRKNGQPILVEVKLTYKYHNMVEQTQEILAEYPESTPVELLLVVPDATGLPFDQLHEAVRVFEVQQTSEEESPFTFTEITTEGT